MSIRRVLSRVPEPRDDEGAYHAAVERYLSKGGDVDARHEHAERGMTMLMCACTRGFLPTIDHLIARGANHDMQAGSGRFTALMYATRGGRHAVVKRLLEAGAAVDVVDSLGRTAILQSRGPESMKLGSDVYHMCVPPTADVNRCVDLIRERMGLPALAVEEREHRVREPGDMVGVRSSASASDDKGIGAAQQTVAGQSSSSDLAAIARHTPPAPNESNQLLCEACGRPGTLRCGACKAARYCSAACQKTAWREHKIVCRRAQ